MIDLNFSTSLENYPQEIYREFYKKSSLKKRIKSVDDNFFDFLKGLLEIDPNRR